MALTAKKVYAILKRQISDMEAKIKTPIIYRGTVATVDLLPLNPDIGDMYNIESKSVYGEAGMNVAWNGVVWDTMGAPIDMSLYIKSSELADWVKQQNKPTYTAEEVGALPADTKIPSKTSDLQNDSGFLTKIPDNYLSGTDKTLSVSGKAADAKAVGDKNVELLADISNKLNKNQGSENSGKIAGINESGDIVPMFPVSVDYNEETNCLEFGSDQKMELNQGIGLDSTLTKTGYAADAGVVGEITNSLKEDIVANSNELYNKEKEEIAVEPSDYNLLENKVAYIDTNNEIMTYENANAYVMHKIVISGEKYRILSQTHGSVNTLLYAICDSNGKVINSAKMGVSPNTYITTEISIPSNGVKLYLNEFPTQTYPLVVNKIETINISKINGKETVNCWGDSLTRGVGVGDSYSKAFPYVLYGLLDGREVINCGVGGENTINIASRQGGLPNIVKPFTIPANASKVEVKLTNIYGGSTGILLQGGSALDPTTGKYVMTAQINPCSINGVEGTLTYENGKYYFSRSENGESVIVSRPTPLITYAMKSMRDNINIIWIGTNGGFTTSAELIECIEAMIDYMSPIKKKYIVIGIHHLVSTVTETFEMIEKNMAMHFGRRYINQRKYMIEYGLSDAGITPTVEDTTAISEDKIPPSLLYDTVHYNDKGYNIIANLVVERGKELGYW